MQGRYRALCCLGCLLLGAGWATAQPIYRNVGPDGRVTYSDRPQPGGTAPAPATAETMGRAVPSAAPSAGLPFSLQQVVNRFPVVLYAAPGCGPCDGARQMLVGRGVPFTERTVQSNEDIEALQRLTGDNSLPVVTIGTQQLRGYSAAEWVQYLDAAGYPKSSQLPSSYRAPPARPLVAVQAATPRPADAAAPNASAPAPLPAPDAAPRPAPAPASPSGIQF